MPEYRNKLKPDPSLLPTSRSSTPCLAYNLSKAPSPHDFLHSNMPGPAVCVVAAIGTVAAAVAFKEFVYDPHLSPIVDAWVENLKARHRQRQQRRQAVAVPQRPRSPSTSSSSDDDVPLKKLREKREKKKQSRESMSSTSPIELEMLAAKEADEWSGVSTARNQSGLRSRLPSRPASSCAPVSPNLMDEVCIYSLRLWLLYLPLPSSLPVLIRIAQHGSPLLSQRPLPPSRNTDPDILFNYPGSPSQEPPARSSLSPTISLSSVSELSEDPFRDPQAAPPRALPGLHLANLSTQGAPALLSPGLPTPLSLSPRASPQLGFHSSRSSMPEADTDTALLTSSMMTSAYLTPQGGPASLPPSHSGRSTPSAVASPSPQINVQVLSAVPSPSPSSPMSPFSDFGSPLLPPVHIPASGPTAVREDQDVFSLPSNVSSDSGDDDFDLASLPESDTSSWDDAHDEAASPPLRR
ncbi:hypothetical protein EVG20_g7230 [Dentipellis fragilis]|uniref:Uncharacterized protein n=1 Tax=Dentipellis fragilis TaxID=205917 RepID=A0A4Y9YFJ2_9AGAM|nr:hypothetical protein EVG20_g7230 [Dentipellis fragilis]